MSEDESKSDYEHLLYRAEDRVAHITLNRPEKRNALNKPLRNEIVAALKAAERDDEVSVILINGAGAGFCAGYDLSPNRSGQQSEYISAKWFDAITDQTQRHTCRTG